MQAFVKIQPITRAANTVRGLTEGGPVAADLLWAILWRIAVMAVFAPPGSCRYRNG